MKILMVLTRGDTLGGAQIHVAELSAELRRRGHEVVWALGCGGPLTERAQREGQSYVLIPGLERDIHPFNDLRAAAALKRLIRRTRPDLVHAHTAKAGFTARLAGLFTRTPLVYTVHGWQFAPGIGLFQRLAVYTLERLLAPFTRAFITVSAYDQALGRRAGLARGPRLGLILNGVADRPAAALPPDPPFRWLMVARFQAQKAQEWLIEALSRCRCRTWTLELVGEGPRRQELEALVRRLGLAEQVTFSGQLADPGPAYDRCHAYALTSRWEGLPLTVLEALRAGRPVVATDVGGTGEALGGPTNGPSGDTACGVLVPPGDTEALTRVLDAWMDDPAGLAARGLAARRRYEARFSLVRQVDETEAVYRRVLSPGIQ